MRKKLPAGDPMLFHKLDDALCHAIKTEVLHAITTEPETAVRKQICDTGARSLRSERERKVE